DLLNRIREDRREAELEHVLRTAREKHHDEVGDLYRRWEGATPRDRLRAAVALAGVWEAQGETQRAVRVWRDLLEDRAMCAVAAEMPDGTPRTGGEAAERAIQELLGRGASEGSSSVPAQRVGSVPPPSSGEGDARRFRDERKATSPPQPPSPKEGGGSKTED